jgi:hypothetical protein
MVCLGQAAEHDADHGEADEGCYGIGVAFEVSGKTAVARNPGERTFDRPSSWQDDEAVRLCALDDLELPCTGLGDNRRPLRSLVAAVGEDAFDEGEQSARATQQERRAVAVLHIGRMDDDVQQQAERVDEDMPLAAGDFLACVEALRIDRRPPFCAALALWLSMIAADGLASRPSFSRTAT